MTPVYIYMQFMHRDGLIYKGHTFYKLLLLTHFSVKHYCQTFGKVGREVLQGCEAQAPRRVMVSWAVLLLPGIVTVPTAADASQEQYRAHFLCPHRCQWHLSQQPREL